MKSLLNKKNALVVSALIVAIGLSGCSSLKEMLSGDDSVDYKSVVRTDPLSIPPDMTQAASDPRFRAPDSGATTFSQFQKSGQASPAAQASSAQAAVLPTRGDMRVMRDGDLRWLSIDWPADRVFSSAADFWTETGFTLDVTDPKAGLIITNWSENRANIPDSWIRQLIGKAIPGAWDSGTRDKFRTRIERNGNRTEVYITHQHMVEEAIGRTTGGTTADIRWTIGKEDPGLNAAMLARMMVFFGEDVDGARKKMAQAKADPQSPKVVAPDGDKTKLVIDESFDRAWRRVGVALDSGGFAVDDRDRSTGEYYVRYVDVDTGMKREEPHFLARLFGAKDAPKAPTYRIRLTSVGSQTEVTILDDKGARDTSATAQRLLGVLSDKI
ncbi:outer membrane protein assembly factor BamC [Zwartia vadi]|uniref:outer membrane protein assembly factor BamC n=1 Tax=Zwartia vadi TaxID=3058168 RepID=UPI0025B54426|nr:outer membrane protein assembly factor BamC [Zwartia vadi]MDN3986808.1 outer membrane protein assembly factor BamC [Zwartia vadi]